MKIRIIGAILISVISFGCFATAQIPDVIQIGDVKYQLNTNPLNKYLTEIKWERPANASVSSANWRGYLAAWKVEAGNLLLTDMTISVHSETEEYSYNDVSIFKDVFPDKKEIIADWFSGALIVPYGEMINYVHLGYGSSYENYIILQVSKGIVIEHLDLVADEFAIYKNRKFQAFRETKEFQEELESLINGEYDWTEEQALDYMQSIHAEYYLSL